MLSLALLLAVAPAPAPKPVPPRSFIPPVTARAVVMTPSGLRFETLRPGTGAKPTTADLVLVTYEAISPTGPCSTPARSRPPFR
ncbi:MAG TPA: hypothetical protein VGB04_06770 [Allosphingosinicella sp.]|jgi:hypothetical protein